MVKILTPLQLDELEQAHKSLNKLSQQSYFHEELSDIKLEILYPQFCDNATSQLLMLKEFFVWVEDYNNLISNLHRSTQSCCMGVQDLVVLS